MFRRCAQTLALFFLAPLGVSAAPPAQVPFLASSPSPPAREGGGRSTFLSPPSIAPAHAGWPLRIEARLAALADQRRPVGAAELDPSLTQQLGPLAERADELADIGIVVRDLHDGRTIFDWHGEQAFNPASNQKLFTAIAAVSLLGPDYRFATRVRREGDTLYLVGEGDPSLQLADVEALVADVVASTNVSEVERIVYDDTAFTPRRFGPGYDHGGRGVSYMAPSGALSLQFNTVEIKIAPRGPGEPVGVATKPACEHIVVDSSAVTAERGLDVTTHAEAGHTVVRVRGGLRRGGRAVHIRRRITDPGAFTASAFAAALAKRSDTAVLEIARGVAPEHATLIAQHRSAPLPEVLESALKYSNNFTSEQLLRTIAYRATGNPGDWKRGKQILQRLWTAIGGRADELQFDNASGLSYRGRATPDSLARLLALATRGDRKAVVDALPVGGRDGTLRDRLRGTNGRVRAKSGTLRGASALSGVVTTRSGEPRLAFSILVNGPMSTNSTRRIQDRIVRVLVAHVAQAERSRR